MTSSKPSPDETSTPRSGGTKGRPTRSRREAEAARRRPLVVTDRKEARRRDRERNAAARTKQQQALMTGDESAMPIQHRGPERRAVRDIVDSRHNIAEYFFPIALVFMLVALIIPLVRQDLYAVMSTGMIVVLWGGILLCVIDGFRLRSLLRKELTARFGSPGQGLVGYGILRAMQIRRWRLPRAQVKHGGEPVG